MKNGSFEKIGVMLDCSFNAVPTVETLKEMIDLLSKMGYNRLELYTEDTYEIKNRPYFGYLRGRYSSEELKEIDAYAINKGIELTPCIQVLAHLSGIFREGHFESVKDCNDILLVDEPETYKLIEDMFISLAENFTSREVNIGCDEAFMLGLGKFLDKFGYQDKAEIFNRHLEKVLEIADKYGFKCSIWDCMYFRFATGGSYSASKPIPEEILNQIPKNLSLIYYNYCPKTRELFEAHKQFDNEIEFAGGAWRWLGFAPDNEFSIKSAEAAVADSKEFGVKKIMITAWGAESSNFSILPTLYYFGRLANGESVEIADLEKGFKDLTGIGFADFLSSDINSFAWLKEIEGFHGKTSSADKVFLYNDLFCGKFDSLCSAKECVHYAERAQELKLLAKGKFAYIFKTLQALCEILALKSDMGIRTRQAYDRADKTELANLAQEYGVIVKRIQKFYALYRKQWMKENKPFGFEVQDVRLGGLIQRIKSCRQTLLEYCDGKVSRIPELDENILPLPESFVDEFGCFLFDNHLQIVSVNRM